MPSSLNGKKSCAKDLKASKVIVEEEATIKKKPSVNLTKFFKTLAPEEKHQLLKNELEKVQ